MRLFFLFLCFISVCSVSAQSDTRSKAFVIDSIARTQLGVDYKYATCSPDNSFDCSGFVSYVYTSVGIECSRSSAGYGSLGYEVSLEEAKQGDCIIFSGTTGPKDEIGHVGIVLQNDSTGLFFIHCSSSKKHLGVVITEYYSSRYPDRFISVRRLFDE